MLLATALLLLASCATAPTGCNGVGFKEYDRAFELQFADELDKVAAGSATDTFITDAKRMRNEVRACKGIPATR